MCRPLLTVFDSLNTLAVMQMVKMGEGRSRGRERGEEKGEVDGDRWRWRWREMEGDGERWLTFFFFCSAVGSFSLDLLT